VGIAAGDSIVVVGAGTVGTWDTEVELANPSDSSLDVQIGADRFFEHGCASPPPCPFARVTIPPKGSVRLAAADIFHATADGLFTMYVIPEDGVTLPTVRARVGDAAAPLQAVELPAVRTSTVLDSNTGSLIFPSVRRTATGHSNLILTNVDLVSGLTAHVDVRMPDGSVIAQTDLTVDPDNVIFLVDFLKTLGIDSLDNGQIVVSRTSTGGTPWGFVAAVDSVNGVFISLGRNP
jgi:hypothetical protein